MVIINSHKHKWTFFNGWFTKISWTVIFNDDVFSSKHPNSMWFNEQLYPHKHTVNVFLMPSFDCINMALFFLRFWHFVWSCHSWWSTGHPFNPSQHPHLTFKSGFYCTANITHSPGHLVFHVIKWTLWSSSWSL